MDRKTLIGEGRTRLCHALFEAGDIQNLPIPRIAWVMVNGVGRRQILIDGIDPGNALREDPVNALVSKVAAIPEVRELLVAKQREYLTLGSLVMEGRDIGSVVFPDTPYKLYIDASEEVRRQRRAAEGQNDEVAKRDRQDSQRRTSPLMIADGALVIDSSDLGIAEVVERARQVGPLWSV